VLCSGASAKHFYNHFGDSVALDLLPIGMLMSSRAVSTSARNLFRRFGRNRKGSAAVEFALVAPPFIALLFAILETGIIFFADQYLETITQDGARMIMTGQAQNGNYTQAQFHSYVCSQVVALFNCNNISVNVQSFSSFETLTATCPISNGTFVNNMQYNPGNPNDVVIVQLFYQWPQIVTGLGYNITNLNGNYRLLCATAAFRNEPYPSS
jgi:Flp pilus assembly protein TadG